MRCLSAVIVSTPQARNIKIVLISSTACGLVVHHRCLPGVTVVCPTAFRPDQVRAAFVRCFASLFYTYRRFLHPASGDRRKAGMVYHFNMDQFLKSVPHGDSEYMSMLRDTFRTQQAKFTEHKPQEKKRFGREEKAARRAEEEP